MTYSSPITFSFVVVLSAKPHARVIRGSHSVAVAATEGPRLAGGLAGRLQICPEGFVTIQSRGPRVRAVADVVLVAAGFEIGGEPAIG